MSTVIATRRSHDGTVVHLWDDGVISGRMGYALPGVPIRRPKDKDGALRAGWLFMGEVELYDTSELPALERAARSAATPGELREKTARALAPVLKPTWEVYHADRDGRPTLRVWRLPRLRWPGLLVWDHVSQGASGGRYELLSVDREGVAETTGFRFHNLRDLTRHLIHDQPGS